MKLWLGMIALMSAGCASAQVTGFDVPVQGAERLAPTGEVVIQVTVEASQGSIIEVSTPEGVLIGSIRPYGVSGRSTHTLVLSKELSRAVPKAIRVVPVAGSVRVVNARIG